MKIRNPFPFRDYLHVLMHTGVGAPYALEISVRKVYALVSLIALVFASLFLGTLLFFRELESSRQLSQSLMELQIEKKLTQNFSIQSVSGPKAEAQPEIAPAKIVEPKPIAVAHGRISGLNVECSKDACDVVLGMVPSRAGSAEGKLYVVLHNDVKRIGAATHTSGTLSQYIVYPGFETTDVLDITSVSKSGGKTFKFSKALQSNIRFELNPSLTPVAVEAFVFDVNGKLVSQERKALETPKSENN
ncbi:MAG: hypothetical protein KDD51_07835 [Bdellovibrionales bacterium]|nr:hypothetical protein [Bdellovibrionales bacterium]